MNQPAPTGLTRTGGWLSTVQRGAILGLVTAATTSLAPILVHAQGATRTISSQPGNPYGEWRYWGGDLSSTRWSPVDQVTAANFSDLEVAWVWRGDNFGPSLDGLMRSTPIFADGILYTVAGQRRQVVAIDPVTGETLWTYREPNTQRWEDSPRQNYGRGVAYGEIDGRGVIYLVTPGFFLHALDAKTGRPLEGFGGKIPIEGFPETGVIDMLATLGYPYDVEAGIDPTRGAITTSSPPLVVNGVLIVGNSAHQGGGNQTRIENVRGDVQAFDARTGKHLWSFHTLPQAGEFGNDTWENDAWKWSGNINVWAPLSADPERNLVYLPTDAPTNDYFGGFRPGANLFGSSLVALDLRTGERRWHFQMIHHDIWDWDLPVPPILVDLQVDGRTVPAVVQASKQTFIYAFNRETGEPIWPIVERPVPAGNVPGEWYSPTQPFPTRPAPVELQGLSENDLMDFTPELRARALQNIEGIKLGPIFTPYVQQGNEEGFRAAAQCPSATGGTNIPGGPVMDPESGILYVQSRKICSGGVLAPGSLRDDGSEGVAPGSTVVDYAAGGGGGFGSVEGLPIFKPPYGRITAIDMNTGEHLWWIPNGDTPDRIANNPLLSGIDVPNTGFQGDATVLVTRSLLMFAEGRGGRALWYGVDKRTGERVGSVEIPAPVTTAPMTFLHDGKQYIVLPVAGDGIPGSLVALRLR
ncbi:MAG: PQQ-binding-like beta-propeller repeat protein [Gemmatimonadota bacterium]|jgi:quinoprotein glucose dehydrogenase|nr:PQQ-binding-like beta-propeller repeat protein [Gemmatimonadota bacterium]